MLPYCGLYVCHIIFTVDMKLEIVSFSSWHNQKGPSGFSECVPVCLSLIESFLASFYFCFCQWQIVPIWSSSLADLGSWWRSSFLPPPKHSLYHVPLTSPSTHGEVRDKANTIPLFSLSLPTCVTISNTKMTQLQTSYGGTSHFRGELKQCATVWNVPICTKWTTRRRATDANLGLQSKNKRSELQAKLAVSGAQSHCHKVY